ncbi:ABC transporter substrate-binding protein [Methanospirillum stamsii]|nr:ABC transporter substrate-binding protein [Methanospirillum stamsii]
MDDIIDEDDITYLKGIISGVNEKTQFADANYDGIVNEDDISQIESIIAGDETTLTLVDCEGVTVSLDVPVSNIITLFTGPLRRIVQLGAVDKVVGIGNQIQNSSNLLVLHAYPELETLPKVGSAMDPSQEAIVSLNPDVIIGTFHTDKDTSQVLSQNTGIPFIYVKPEANFDSNEGAYETWRMLGLILGKDASLRAENLIQYCDEKINEINEYTSTIPDEEKTRAYICAGTGIPTTTNIYEPIEIAGGINVAVNTVSNPFGWGQVDISNEQILDWNPDVILIPYTTQDVVLSDPTLQVVNAVKNSQVYDTMAWKMGWDPATGLCECYYLAKIFYPDLFKDLNVEGECNEILEKFYGVSGLYDWMLENCGDYVTWN